MIFSLHWGQLAERHSTLHLQICWDQEPGLQAIQHRNAKDRSDPYIITDEKSLINKIENCIQNMIDDANAPVAVGLGFDGTKVPKVLNVSTAFHAISGGAFPNHCIPFDGMNE